MTSAAVRAALAELGLAPEDLDPAVLATVAAHLEADGPASMDDWLRVERDLIGDRHHARVRRIFGAPDGDPDPPPAA